MKHIYFTLIALSFSVFSLSSQSIINIDFSKERNINAIILANINGNVNVTGNSNEKTILKGKKEIDLKDEKKVNVVHVVHNDTLIIYIQSPCSTLRLDYDGNYLKNVWSVYNWKEHEKCDDQPEFKIDLELSLPHNKSLAVSTINEGNVQVESFNGQLWANNIKGSVFLRNVKEVHQAKTINGDVTIHFSSVPTVEGKFYSLNGDIESFYPKGVNMDMTFKSFMGDFYTDAENVETMPSKVTKEKNNKGFKINMGDKSKMRIGNGGITQNFETFNGDAIVRTKSD